MRKPAEINLNEVRAQMDSFRAGCGSVSIASDGPKGLIASYAPYVNLEGKHYIYISEIADHYYNLKEGNEISLQFIEDESKAANIAARVRSSSKAKVNFMSRDETFDQVMDVFEAKHGNIYQVLRGMTDFHLIQLTLGEGSYVKGFGLAFDVEEDGTLIHKRGLNEKGHR